MRNTFVAAGIALLLVGAGCSGGASGVAQGPELGYALPADGSVAVTSSSVDAATLVDADLLFAQADECGYARTADYYVDLEKLFVGTSATRYVFTATGDFAEPTSWTVTVMENAPAYASFESFKQDFDICAVGGDLYPKQAGTDALLFADSCGSGYAADNEPRKQGCDIVRKAIEPTLSVK